MLLLKYFTRLFIGLHSFVILYTTVSFLMIIILRASLPSLHPYLHLPLMLLALPFWYFAITRKDVLSYDIKPAFTVFLTLFVVLSFIYHTVIFAYHDRFECNGTQVYVFTEVGVNGGRQFFSVDEIPLFLNYEGSVDYCEYNQKV